MILAHGIGGRSDLPLPAWMFSWGATVALGASFVALGIYWRTPRLAAAAAGRALPAVAERVADAAAWVLRALGLVLFATMLVASWWGPDDSAPNWAPYLLYVGFWVGMQFLSAVAGDAWRALNPLDTLALLILGNRTRPSRRQPGAWTAAAGLASFAWLELAYHDPASPRAIGVWLTAYTVAHLAGAAVWGRDWLRTGEGFAALFGALAHLAPLHRDPDTNRLRVRPPLAGLAAYPSRPGTEAMVLLVLGSTSFDGVTRLDVWTRDIVDGRSGWDRTWVTTVGLVFTIGVVTLLWQVACRTTAAVTRSEPRAVSQAFVPSLIPIVLAYSVAHYFSLFVFDGYNVVALASDPFGRGWDLFGTIDVVPNYTLISTTTIAWVQAAAVVLGHVAGVVAAHDRALEEYQPASLATRSQYPMLAVMVVYTVGALGLLLGA